MHETNTVEKLPCGCSFQVTETPRHGPTFLLEACSLNCPTYHYVVARARREGKPIEPLDLRGATERRERPVNNCPHCGQFTDLATSVGNGKELPEAGDTSLCAYCGYFSRFTAELALEKLDDSVDGWAEEEAEYLADPVVGALVAALRQVGKVGD